MKIYFGKTVSIGPISVFDSPELPAFTVLTGKNGSGKTKLLEYIATGQIIVMDDSTPINKLQIQIDNLEIVVDSVPQSPYSGEPGYAHIAKLSTGNELIDNVYRHSIIQGQALREGRLPSTYTLATDNYYTALLEQAQIWLNSNGGDFKDIEAVRSYLFEGENSQINLDKITRRVETEFFDQEKSRRFSAASEKLYFQVSESDSLFTQNASVLFNAYLERRFWNSFYRTLYGDEFDRYELLVTDDEYVKRYPAPWTVINRILSEHNFDFEYDALRFEQFSPGRNIVANLRKKSTSAYVAFSTLSSGEQMIIGLLTRVFLAEYYRGNIERPKLLMLDEPDAHLQPEMTATLISVLQNEFVERLGMKVIMTTHSPTTVALAPENAIFELTAAPGMELKAVTKDEALAVLTGFLPTLSIDYNNHRQIFVESPNDRDYYQSLYEIHQRQPDVKLTHKLYFIASAAGKGNCQQVKDVVRSLRNAGNKTALGIIDWDKKYSSFSGADKFVAVHGERSRYSIESYLFDPILIIAFLISKRYGRLMTDLQLGQYPEQRIGEESEGRLQQFVDYFFECFQRIPDFAELGELADIEYQNDKRVKVPRKYLHAEGHNGLAGWLTKAFPEINIDWNSTKTKDEIINLAVKCYPFVSKDTMSLITLLANEKF